MADSGHGHDHHADPAQGDAPDREGHACLLLEGDDCCESQALILEDRSLKVPGKSPADLAALANGAWADMPAHPSRVHAPATGPPPGPTQGVARRLALLCTYLI